jgi:hypothetical protein
MELSPFEVTRIRRIAERIRSMKEANYGGVTWDAAKLLVSKEESSSTDEFYKTLALLEFFLDEDRALCPLEVFLSTAGDIAVDLRERDMHYAIGQAERDKVRTRVDAYLNRVGKPTTSRAAFDYYQVQIDRVFTSSTFIDLLESISRLGATLESWYPNAYLEAQYIGKSKADLIRFSELASSPISLGSATDASRYDFWGLKQYLHRFIAIGLFSKVKEKREVKYIFLTSIVDVNALRKEWSWLWCMPGQRLSLHLYQGQPRR